MVSDTQREKIVFFVVVLLKQRARIGTTPSDVRLLYLVTYTTRQQRHEDNREKENLFFLRKKNFIFSLLSRGCATANESSDEERRAMTCELVLSC